MRRMASEFQGQFMEAMREVEREADLDSVKKEFQAISDQAKIDTSFDPVGMVRDDVTKAASTLTDASPAERGQPEIGTSEIGTSEIALTTQEPVATATLADREAEPEPPAAPRSAAE